MSEMVVRRALLSVFDKTGLAAFARALHERWQVELLSTGGTARALREAGLPVTLVETVTGAPEMLDGRVKTLHPRIHGALLADRENAEHVRQLQEQGIAPIDLVVVNLYAFEQTVARAECSFAEAIEMIDIGGPCLLRASAKNHRGVLVVSDPGQYDEVLGALGTGDAEVLANLRRKLAAAAFARTCAYDGEIVEWLGKQFPGQTAAMRVIAAHGRQELRYGENPQQAGRVLSRGAADAGLLVGPGGSAVELSYNNLLDATAAFELCRELDRARESLDGAAHVACFIKHTNACGVGVAAEAGEAYRRAYLGDPNAAMGGILAMNTPVDRALAEEVLETFGRLGKPLQEAGAAYAPGGFFVEVWVAPGFDEDAVAHIREAKAWGQRVRLLTPAFGSAAPGVQLRSIWGGLLEQDADESGLNEDEWRVVSRRPPSAREMADLRLAWLVCKHTKSNAITVCRDGMLLGNGAGQMSRVMSCRIATWLARENGHAEALTGAVAASDAFFPFRDGPDILAEAGVTALIQPGGSKRDAEVITAADARGLAMVVTGTRHFRH